MQPTKFEMDEPAKTDKPWQHQTGHHIGEMYGYIAEGLFQTQEEVDDQSIAKMSVENTTRRYSL